MFAFRNKSALNNSNSPCLSDSSSYDEGRSGKFEQLDKPSFVLDFIENSLLKDFNSLILFKIISLLAWLGQSFL